MRLNEARDGHADADADPDADGMMLIASHGAASWSAAAMLMLISGT